MAGLDRRLFDVVDQPVKDYRGRRQVIIISYSLSAGGDAGDARTFVCTPATVQVLFLSSGQIGPKTA